MEDSSIDNSVLRRIKTKAVYSSRLAEFLTVNGFWCDLLNITTNKREGYEVKRCYIFRDSNELYNAIGEYLNMRQLK